MSIRVLHIIDHLGYGGAPIVVKNIVEKLDSQHIDSFVCALRTNPEAIPIESKLISLTYHKYNPFAILAIAKICKEHKIDIIHAHLQKSIICSLLAGFFCDAKIIIHEHGPIFRGGTGFLYRLLLKLLSSKATIAIANSQATKNALLKTTGIAEESIYIVNNFIDLTRFNPALYNKGKVKITLGIAENQIVIGFVGRLDPCKGMDLLINAAEILCKQDKLFRFVIVGHGAQRRQLEQQVERLGLKENVTFTGLSKNPAELISAFDVAVIPSRREAFGIAAVEFMRMNVPIIASRAGGLTELIQHNKTGILLHNLNAGNIAQAISKLTHDDALCKSLIENAEVFSCKFDGQQQLEQLKQIYTQFAIRSKQSNENE